MDINTEDQNNELTMLNFEDIIYFDCSSEYAIKEEFGELFKTGRYINQMFIYQFIDANLKNEKKYTDDLETFKKKLIENNHSEYTIDKEPITSNSSTTKEKPELENLENNNMLNPENQDWDQFELNEKRFNVKSDYNEVLYTTELDTNNLSEDKKERADKIEKVFLNLYNNLIFQ